MKFAGAPLEVARGRSEKREHRQAQVLRDSYLRTRDIFQQWTAGRLTDKELGQHLQAGRADLGLIQQWRRGHPVCCLLCIRKGKRCICRRVKGVSCVNCLCQGECQE